jgi:hypothetical protein
MNIVESMKHVLKNKRQSIFSVLVKEDLFNYIKTISTDIASITKQRNFSAKNSFKIAKESVQDYLLLIKAIPQRVNDGSRIFGLEFISELEKLTDPKQKTVFCMKVLAGMSKLALSSAYDLGLGEAKLIGLGKSRKMVANVVVTRVLFKAIQSFIIRFIEEIENEVTDPDELIKIRDFKETVLDDSGNAIDKFFDGVTDPGDRAFVIVDNFKRFVLTGE